MHLLVFIAVSAIIVVTFYVTYVPYLELHDNMTKINAAK